MANKFSPTGRGAKGFAAEFHDVLGKPFDPWSAAGDRGSDEKGYERGAQSQGSDDAEFLRPSTSRTDHEMPLDISGDAMADQGPGPYGEGSGPVRQVGGGSSPPRYAPKKGPAQNGGL